MTPHHDELRTETPIAMQHLSATHVMSYVQTVVEAISPAGGRLTTTHPRQFSVGEGLRLDLRLPTGDGLRVLGVVRGVQRKPGSAVQHLELMFRGHGPADQEQLAQSERRYASNNDAPICARITEKFDLTRTSDRLSITLVGALSASEAQALSELVEEALVLRRFELGKGRPLVVSIDATRFSACPQPALEWMGRWLVRLASPDPMLGVLVGASSVGIMQLQRLVRAVGVAEHLMICGDHDEAEATIDAMTRELFGGR